MALERHLQEAADRLRMASIRINEARTKLATQDTMQEWLMALTDCSFALADVHDLNMEALQERVNDLIWHQRRAAATQV